MNKKNYIIIPASLAFFSAIFSFSTVSVATSISPLVTATNSHLRAAENKAKHKIWEAENEAEWNAIKRQRTINHMSAMVALKKEHAPNVKLKIYDHKKITDFIGFGLRQPENSSGIPESIMKTNPILRVSTNKISRLKSEISNLKLQRDTLASQLIQIKRLERSEKNLTAEIKVLKDEKQALSGRIEEIHSLEKSSSELKEEIKRLQELTL